MIGKLLYLCILFPVNLFIPGFLLTRKNRQPQELRFILSISLSLLVLFIVSFLFYLLRVNSSGFILFSTLCFFAIFPFRKELRTLLCSPPVKSMLLHYGIFLVWILLISMTIHNYSGGRWSGDWEEHYQRSLFFLNHNSLGTLFIKEWTLPARPPLFNLVASFFLHHLGSDFIYYQLTGILLNSLVFFGAWGIMLAIGQTSKRIIAPATLLLLILFLGLNPSIVQNVTLVWTRSLTNFFILTGLALYLLARSTDDQTLRKFAWLNLGLAMVTHYSAAPYILGIALVELYFLMMKRREFKEFLLNLAILFAPLSPWLTFALCNYGWQGTFLSNSTATDAMAMTMAEAIAKTWGNILSTIIPHPLRHTDTPELFNFKLIFHQVGWMEDLREYFFLLYQVNIPFMIGSLGGIIAIGQFTSNVFRRLKSGMQEETVLLTAYLIFVLILGIALHGSFNFYGVGHICGQPLAIIAVVYLATRFLDASTLVKNALVAGLIFDFLFGIALQLQMEHFSTRGIFSISNYAEYFSPNLLYNAFHKTEAGYLFISDLPFAAGIMVILTLLLLILIRKAIVTSNRPASLVGNYSCDASSL